MYIHENFAMNLIRPKFLSLLLTGEICIGVDRKGYTQRIRKWRISRYSKVVYNLELPDAYCTYIESTFEQAPL